MVKSEYEDSRWQKKRMEIIELRGKTCQCCSKKDIKFEVHHIDYSQERHVWEYDADELICLCSNCHEVLHALLSSFREVLAKLNQIEMEDVRQIIFLLSMIDQSRSKLIKKIFDVCMKFQPSSKKRRTK